MESDIYKKIHYFEIGNGATTIVLIHGNSFSAETFILQRSDKLYKYFQLLTLDLPGHGLSGKSDHLSQDYSFGGLRTLLTEFLEVIPNQPYILAGHSLGGHLALECLPELKHCKGLLIWGTPPLTSLAEIRQQFLPHPDVKLAYQNKLDESEVQILANVFISPESAHNGLIKDAILKTDGHFREVIGQSLLNGEFLNERVIIENTGIPVAIFHGCNDNLISLNYLNQLKIRKLWKHDIQVIKDSGHCPHLDQSAIFNAQLIEFVNEII
jgi:pimeloyl-ACP methyl ester carboxylesterase